MSRHRLELVASALAAILIVVTASARTQEPADADSTPPQPPSNLTAEDHPLDGGEAIDLYWTLSPDDPFVGATTLKEKEAAAEVARTSEFAGYKVYRSRTEAEREKERKDELAKEVIRAKADATAAILGEDWEDRWKAEDGLLDEMTVEELGELRAARKAAADAAEIDPDESFEWMFVGLALPGVDKFEIDKLESGEPYRFQVESYALSGLSSTAITTDAPAYSVLQWFDGGRFWLAIITLVLCGSVVFWINHARSGKPVKVRKIAGLEAVDEAVGRATEMGRSCLFVPGIQDMNDIQTIAGITVLARVARTAAEYDAKVEVPTSRSLVMTTARETVQASFLSAGRPDAYNEDLIYYVTDEQFGYVAYLSGMMVREKPAACFYMGSFFAESLILAETGNSIGAIQIAGTAQPAQLPFFVAACDYTLIGEEFFAASAYLSGSPEELGSLKGQDVGKVVVAIGMIVGILFFTLFEVTRSETFLSIVDYIKDTMLT